jgi:hypothetical protein
MNGLNKLPGLQRTRHGLEPAICRRLPAVLAWGTVLPLLVAALRWLMAPGQPDAGPDDAGRMLLIHPLRGLVVLHRPLLPTLAMVFGIAMLMKGPASVASPCPPPGRGLRA